MVPTAAMSSARYQQLELRKNQTELLDIGCVSGRNYKTWSMFQGAWRGLEPKMTSGPRGHQQHDNKSIDVYYRLDAGF